jgi:hypothetical protein
MFSKSTCSMSSRFKLQRRKSLLLSEDILFRFCTAVADDVRKNRFAAESARQTIQSRLSDYVVFAAVLIVDLIWNCPIVFILKLCRHLQHKRLIVLLLNRITRVDDDMRQKISEIFCISTSLSWWRMTTTPNYQQTT